MDFRIVFFWLLLIAFVVPAYYFALGKVLAIPPIASNFRRWGYPRWFMRSMGLAEMAACLCLMLKPLVYVGLACYGVFILGALATHFKHRSRLRCILIACLVGLHLLAIYLCKTCFHSA